MNCFDYRAVNIAVLRFILTGDFHFLMPCLGLMNCSSSNPCPFCPRVRSKVGGVAKWQEGEVEPRTLSSLHTNYAGWVLEGEVQTTAQTRRWTSVTSPFLVEGEGDTWDMKVLDKVVPGSLHLFLAANDLINHLEKDSWKDVKQVLKDLFGIEAHSYQGKERNFQGPEIRRMLAGIHKLFPLMRTDPIRKLYLDVMVLMKKVAHEVFSLDLHPKWKETLEELKSSLITLNSFTSFPMTPKFHIITEHIGEWVEKRGRSLGRESEQPGESLHHLWKRLLEGQGEVKDKNSDAFVAQVLWCLVKFNSDNV